jgi:uncharacterized protein with HEPN domain
MKNPDDSTRLQHILDSARKAVQFTQGRNRADLDTDEMLCFALIRLLEIIGEASKEVSEQFRAKNPQIAWPKMAGMRNRLIHGYFDVDPTLVWETVTRDLPPLINQLEKVIGKEE